MTGGKQTVYIVDDDPSVGDALSMLLDSVDLHHVRFSSAYEFLASHERGDCGCLVLDIRMPGMSGLELQQKLIEENCALPIIFISGHGDISMAVEAMRRGALDFIRKPFREQQLLDRISEALEKDNEAREHQQIHHHHVDKIGQLTERELEVFNHIAEGDANKVVAIDLGISERTVEVHRASVMKKLGARSLAELVKTKILLQ